MGLTDTLSNEDVVALIREGQAARQQGNRSAALSAFEAAAAIDPSHPDLKLALALELRLLGRLDEAEALCRAAMAIEPNKVSAFIELGLVARGRGDYAASLAAFEQAIGAQPGHVGLMTNAVVDLRALGRYDEAENLCKQALAIDPQDGDCLAQMGHIARHRGDFNASLAAFAAASAAKPDHMDLRAQVVLELRELGRLDEAEKSCREALAIDPTHLACIAELGRIARQRGDLVAAVEACQSAIALYPDNTSLKLQIASDLRQLGRSDEAKNFCEEALAIEPSDIWALIELGLIARSKGDYAASLAAFERAMAVQPHHVGLMTNAVADLRTLGRCDEAEELCKQALAIDPKDCDCLAQLGHIARHRGDFNASLAAFAAASAAKPDHMGLRAQVVLELRELGRLDEAEKSCREVLLIEPTHLACLAELVHIARRRGDHVAAVKACLSAIELRPNEAGLRLQMAADLRELGRFDDAERCCQDALQLDPNSAEVFAELGRLARSRGNRELAHSWFRAAVAESPSQLQHRLDLGAELRALERFDEADRALHEALDIDPTDPRLLGAIGHIALRQGDTIKATEAFESALNGDVNDVATALDLTMALCELGCMDVVEQAFSRRIEKNSSNIAALLSLGIARVEQFRLDEAEALFRRAAEIAPYDFICWLCLGRLARQREQHEKALDYFRSARAAMPSHVAPAIETANQLRDLGDLNSARRILEEVLRVHPNEFDATLHMAHLYRREREHKAALRMFHTAHQLQLQHPLPLVEMATEYRALGDPRESEALLRTALAMAPRNQTVLEQLADHCLDAENYEEALTFARQAIALYPHRYTSYLRASRAALELGDTFAAGRFLDAAEAHCGAHPEIRAMRTSNYMWKRDWDAAKHVLDDAGQQRQLYFCLWTIAAKLAITTGDYNAAMAELPASAPRVSDASEVELLRGQIEEGRWDLQKAATHYRAAVALSPENPGAHFDLARTSLKLLELDECQHHLKRQTELVASSLQLRDQSRNASQTHIGQLLDEFLLDAEQIGALREIRRHPPEQQIDALKQLVLRSPDHTPAAIMLLIALRESGRLIHGFDAANDTAFRNIPQRILQYWDNAQPPSEISELTSSWQSTHPEFQYVRLDDETAEHFLQEHNLLAELRAYRRVGEPAQRADLIRLAYLSVHGGFYADADDRCLAAVSSYLPADATFVAFQEDFGTLANNFLGVVPNHPVIKLALQLGTEAVNRGDHDFLWLATGPGLLTRAFTQFICQPAAEGSDLGEPTILDMAYTARHIGIHCPVTYKKTERHWSRTSFGKPRKRLSRGSEQIDFNSQEHLAVAK